MVLLAILDLQLDPPPHYCMVQLKHIYQLNISFSAPELELSLLLMLFKHVGVSSN